MSEYIPYDGIECEDFYLDQWFDEREAEFRDSDCVDSPFADDPDDDLDCDDDPDGGWEPPEDWMTDVEADADTLASAGWGTDEDYGYYGGDEY